jgi:hypothetical protein
VELKDLYENVVDQDMPNDTFRDKCDKIQNATNGISVIAKTG